MQQIDQKDTVTAERSRHLRTGWQDRLLACFVFVLFLLQRTWFADITALHTGADLLLGPLCWLACRRGLLPTGIYALCAGTLVGLSGGSRIVLEPLLYLCLGLCLSWLSARLYRRTFFSYALLLAFSCAARALAELCAALIVWQQAPSASVLLLGTLLRFALCFFGGAAEYPILRLFAKSGESFAGRGENAALESKD